MSLRILLLPLPLLSFLAISDVRGQTDVTTEDRVTKLEKVTSQLTRQLMLQQLYVEEAARSSGDSGIKHIRRRNDGSKPYFSETHTARAVAAIHDHSDQVRTVGMGEFIGVLNGVEFRTRHNDYKLKMPSTSSGEYHATEDIPFPEVPPEVLHRTSVVEQIAEMRQWFKAWQDGDHSVRDYRRYFRPNLCYLEGAWTTDTTTIDEPFDSDRHHLLAQTWFELQEQIRFTSYTGDKNFDENFAYLPTTIMNVTNGLPVFGQWNYRILCHPIQGDLNLSLFRPVDSLASRLARKDSFNDYVMSRAARFRLDPQESDNSYRWSVLDELMQQIPGKNNYNASLGDASFGQQKTHLRTGQPLNTAFYHRVYKILKEDAMGEQTIFKGFADRSLFVAETTQPRVAAMSVPYCEKRRAGKRRNCRSVSQRVSYAVPLEIVYTTPLQSWNPHGVELKGDAKSGAGRTVKEGGKRTGKMTPEKAFNGTNNAAYFLTPADFFSGGEVGKGSGDTSRKSVGVLDASGKVRAMRSSGIRIHLPYIPGVGVVRTRWPIMPVSTEGHPIWKELEALRDVVMDMRQYLPYFPTPPPFPDEILNSANKSHVHTILRTSPSDPEPHGLHTHTVELTKQQVKELKQKKQTVVLETSEDNGHSHQLVVAYDQKNKEFRIIRCDKVSTCFDGHDAVLLRQPMKRLAPN